MKTSFISTYALSEASRITLQRQTATVAKLQQEVASGRKADVGLDLGNGTGETVALRQEFERINAIIDTNALTASRLKVTQAALGDLLSNAQSFLATLVSVRDGGTAAGVLQTQAVGEIDQLTSRLNSSIQGRYLFAGINTDVKPVTDFNAQPPNGNRLAAENAFTTYFGFPPGDPAAAGITAADMQTFLDTDFAALFDAAGWTNPVSGWSSAADQPVKSRISSSELADTSVSANEEPFRQLAAAYSMMAALDPASLNQNALAALVDKATELIGDAVAGVTRISAAVGSTQARVATASERLAIQADLLNSRINVLEGVDPNETATRLNDALVQLETSYAVTAKLSRLSIIKYL